MALAKWIAASGDENVVQGYQSALFVLQELPCVTNAVCGMLGPILRKYWL